MLLGLHLQIVVCSQCEIVSQHCLLFVAVIREWNQFHLSEGRSDAEVGIVQNKVYIAGGIVGPRVALTTTSTVDIFDLEKMVWLAPDYITYNTAAIQ